MLEKRQLLGARLHPVFIMLSKALGALQSATSDCHGSRAILSVSLHGTHTNTLRKARILRISSGSMTVRC